MTLNPALDLTYTVDEMVQHATNRVHTVLERAGGKGINVARVLHAAGETVVATGLLGGATGARVADLLAADGVRADFVAIGAETRRTVVVVDPADATGLWEPGPTITAGEWDAFRTRYEDLLDGVAVVVLSGSLPPGLPQDAYATLVRIAARRGVTTLLDAGGDALRHGVAAGPDLAKPNVAELRALEPGSDTPAAAAAVLRAGARAVVVSDGPRGLLALTGTGAWRAVPPEVVAGNPTGAGDACAAALARGLRDGTPWPDRLADAVALSAAAVAAPVAGSVDAALYRRLRPAVTVTPFSQGSAC
ncbi:1-phosphofructokinase family hexose kinase [Virgisporangium aurantiacum]|uniref:1-phosphofructokinase family hexose kinase n=1 Tax=Virgisporangium aurantiacum TaxID=175570 RepID=UPI001EF296AE|nr:hexose kinase [Virgisporangium aurantiacum]